ncbi:MAG: hypothetical protein HY695_18555 [Deltaproteobacteria bacterium]|nr:hypothetical protein [Deltaproteobacteria bacterium]
MNALPRYSRERIFARGENYRAQFIDECVKLKERREPGEEVLDAIDALLVV